MKKVIAVLMLLIVYAGFAFAGETAREGRFIAYENGTVLDTRTNLMWAAKDNGEDINWYDAKKYCENYRGGGYTDWRMPTIDEPAGLYNKGESDKSNQEDDNAHLTKLIQLSDFWLWVSETRGTDAALYIYRNVNWFSKYYTFGRVLPVRSAK